MIYPEYFVTWLTVAVLFQLTNARPSEELKITFKNEKVSSLFDNHCDLVKGE